MLALLRSLGSGTWRLVVVLQEAQAGPACSCACAGLLLPLFGPLLALVSVGCAF